MSGVKEVQQFLHTNGTLVPVGTSAPSQAGFCGNAVAESLCNQAWEAEMALRRNSYILQWQ